MQYNTTSSGMQQGGHNMDEWKYAIDYISIKKEQYEAMGELGKLGLTEVQKLIDRYKMGERTERLKEEMMQCR